MTRLTESEVVQFEQMRAQAEAGQIKYWQIYEALADLLQTQYGVPSTDSAVLWLRGATQANAGQGSFSALIRTYTETQYHLRYGKEIPEGKMQEASNEVAKNLLADLLGDSSSSDAANPWPRGEVPDINRIALADARAVGDVLFGPLLGHDQTETAFTRNSAWSGTLLFSLLGSDQTSRLMSTGADAGNIDTLNDWRDVLYAAVAYRQAFWSAAGEWFTQSAEQKLVDATILGPTLAAQVASGTTPLNLWTTIIQGASGTVGQAFTLIDQIGPEKLLDHLMGTLQGKVLVGSTTEETLASRAKAFFDSYTPSQLQNLGLELLSPTQLAQIATRAKTDFGAFLALQALSPLVATGEQTLAELKTIHAQMAADWQADMNARLYGDTTYELTYSDQWFADRARLLVAWTKAEFENTGWVTDPTALVDRDQLFRFQAEVEGQTGTRILGLSLDNAPRADQEIFFGTDQADTLSGSENTVFGDRLYGGSGADTLQGLSGDDHLEGQLGNDLLEGGEGQDTLRGGSGVDVLRGDAGDDLLMGGAGADVLGGGEGQDALYGGQDNDYLFGAEGNDLLHGGQGSDTLEGGAGNDYLIDEGTTGQTATLRGEDGEDVLDARAVQGAATLDGGGGADWIRGGSGVNSIIGGAGADWIEGGEQSGGHKDVILGGDGADVIVTGAGDDDISGGAGADHLQGGAGNDGYLIDASGGADLIHDAQGNNVLLFAARGEQADWSANYDEAQGAWLTADGYAIRKHTLDGYINSTNSTNSSQYVEAA